MNGEPLAYQLGTTAHLSPLLQKARRLGLHGAESLERLAVQRGCRYYDLRGDSAHASSTGQTTSPPLPAQFSNEELAISLLSICLPSSQHRLRVGAAMLGAVGNSVARIIRLSRLERCEVIVRHIATCGHRVEPENFFWNDLLRHLPELPQPGPDVLPHITRFVAMTGITRRGRETLMQWVRPTHADAA